MSASTYRVRHQVKIVGSVDEAEKLAGLRRLDDVTTTVIRTDLTTAVNDSLAIDMNTVDQALSFGMVFTGKVLYMETDQALTFKLNSGSQVFKLSPTSGAKAKLLWEGEFTAISVSNPSTTEKAALTYMIAG